MFLKVLANKKVFSLDLKVSIEGASRIFKGRAFQSEGATTEKALSPILAEWERTGRSCKWSKFREGLEVEENLS